MNSISLKCADRLLRHSAPAPRSGARFGLSAFFLIAATQLGWSQPASVSEGVKLHQQRKDDAYLALQRGQSDVALAKLSENAVRGATALNPDVQIAHDLVGLAIRAKRARDRNSMVRAVELANSQLGRASGNSADAGAVAALRGHMEDYVFERRTQAIAHYENALRLDPSLGSVSTRLEFLKAVEENARRKAAGNELLRQRAQQHAR